jgi:hypothetical protein
MAGKTTSDLFDRIRFRGRPVAHPDATAISGNARFTALTPRLIRLEWSETGEFEDRGTYAFPARYAPAPPQVSTRTEDGDLIVDTGALVLRYAAGSGRFTEENLSIAFELNARHAQPVEPARHAAHARRLRGRGSAGRGHPLPRGLGPV